MENHPTPPVEPQNGSASPQPPPQEKRPDFSRMAAPGNLEEIKLEELTIDGICGVY